ncbi:hypothetical protein C1631_008800 [Chryseobacterium phosphatilyticum]|uniref:Outer membrane protein beta-barrel domain-containing protein n=1 Tax=Chryseobacterium phosphatilyticum TaxID=475075 RepID=A0A316X986_9FLAO|nr:outer membrane beta-barrel protein [Chryseobacterium phosphatilyticum]PWN70084.1 hypothetical protein C1631_008800 [Chryseobacterium phosphatilyticum]
MNKRKNLVIAIILFQLCGIEMNAQTKEILGIRGGFGFYSKANNNNAVSYKLGVVREKQFQDNFYFNMYLYFNKRAREIETNGETYRKVENFIEFSPAAGCKIQFLPQIKLGLTAGPYIAYGFSGKSSVENGGEKTTWNTFKGTERNNILYPAAKRLDYGASAGLLLEFYKLELWMNYDTSFRKPSEGPNDYENKIRHGILWFGLGLKM